MNTSSSSASTPIMATPLQTMGPSKTSKGNANKKSPNIPTYVPQMEPSSSNPKSEKVRKPRAPRTPKNKPIPCVAPLNSVPYVSPLSSLNSVPDVDALGSSYAPHPMAADISNDGLKIEVTRTGSASLGGVGPAIGLFDIAESNETYFFRVSLPGVSEAEDEFRYFVAQNGNVIIRGVTLTGEKTVCRHGQVFKMLSQNLCPPGEFTISFNLPGPVSLKDIKSELSWGSFKCVVKKAL